MDFEDGMEGEGVSLLLEEEVVDRSGEILSPWASASSLVVLSCFAVS